VTKTLATVTLQLTADHSLSLDDLVTGWLPDLVPHVLPVGWTATIGQLLAMRSGLPDYVPALIGDPPDVTRLQRYFEPEELIGIAVAQPGAREPGSAWRYSNTDYVLLGLTVQRATRQSIPDVFADRIFAPLGLTATYMPETETGIAGPHATGYVRLTATDGYTESTEFSPSECWAAGAIISTPRELARFLEALLSGQLLPRDLLSAMRVMTPAGTSGLQYGMGLARYQLPDGTAIYGQGGTHFGVNCLAFRSDAGRTVVLYQNSWDRVAVGLRLDSPFMLEAFQRPQGAVGTATRTGR
jgi:D-alanyl-D-alanine carboxypeptidase